MCRSPETVLVYFARSAGEDLKQNRFAGKRFHRKLIDRLHRHTLKAIRSTELPVLFFDEENQIGNNLAERLTHAFSEAFARGYKNVIAVGNDTPDLDGKLILQASQNLDRGNSVLGPSLDGGNYLIGLRKKDFNATEFCKALESHDETDSRLSQLLSNHLKLVKLADIDDEKSLAAWLRSSSIEIEKILFRKEVKSSLSSSSNLGDSIQTLNPRIGIIRIAGRAPPLVSAASAFTDHSSEH
ncbi:MAG TPA: DUF2064 domain-containing protein [Cryomorphaceae bacterium]|nr:DUF2064 domain-containing protein [Cryomorphaceae bacterium]